MDHPHPLITQLDALIQAVSVEIAGQVRIADEAEQHLSQPTPPSGVDVAFLLAAPPAAVPAPEMRAPVALSADNPDAQRAVDTRHPRPAAIPAPIPTAIAAETPAPLRPEPTPELVPPPATHVPAGRPRTMREALLS